MGAPLAFWFAFLEAALVVGVDKTVTVTGGDLLKVIVAAAVGYGIGASMRSGTGPLCLKRDQPLSQKGPGARP